MPLQSVRVLLALSGIALGASAALAQPYVRVIASNVAATPSAAIGSLPGAGWAATTVSGTPPFNPPAISPDGRYLAFTGSLAADGTVVTSTTNTGAFRVDFQAAPTAFPTIIARRGFNIGSLTLTDAERLGTFGDGVSVNNTGRVAFTNLTTAAAASNRIVGLYDSPASTTVGAREGTSVNAGTAWGSVLVSPTLHTDGTFSVVSQFTGAPTVNSYRLLRATGPTTATVLAANDLAPGPTGTPTGQLVVPTRPYGIFDNFKFKTDAGGTRFISWGVVGPAVSGNPTASAGDGTILVVNNDVKAQYGVPIPGSGFFNGVVRIDGVAMGPNGDWAARGRSGTNPTQVTPSFDLSESWVITGSGLVAKPGDTIIPGAFPTTWAGGFAFNAVATNCRGDVAISGQISGPDGFFQAIVVSNRRIALQVGDRVDMDNNPATTDDWWVATIFPANANDPAEYIALDGDGWLTAVVGLTNIDGSVAAINSAIVRVRAFCKSDYSRDGATTIDDIFIYLNDWFASRRTADQSCDGLVTIDDIFIFLNDWFASGSCLP
jgi:hypothetical protein